MRKRIRIALISVSILLLLLPLLAFGLRGWLVKRQLAKLQDKFASQFDTDFKYDDFELSGLSTVRLTGIKLLPHNADTLFTADTAWVGVRFWSLLGGNIRLSELELAGGKLYGRQTGFADNLSRFSKKSPDEETNSKPATYADRAERYMALISKQLPPHLVIRRFRFDWQTPSDSIMGSVEQISILDGSLAGRWQMNGSTWLADGEVDTDGPTFDIRLRRPAASYAPIDGLFRRLGLGFSPTDIKLSLTDVKRGDDVSFSLKFESGPMEMFHKRIHTDTIDIQTISGSFHFQVSGNSIEMDSASALNINGLTIKPYAYLHTKPDTTLRFHIIMPQQPAQRYFDALPPKTFQQLAGIEVAGALQIGLRFFYTTKGKDSVDIKYQIKPLGFKVKEYGKGDLTLLQEPFAYKPYFNPNHKMVVGPQSPNYFTLSNIDTLLRKCVLYAEDKDFFHHQGFYEQAFELAALTNIKSGSFKRGGSTISMQLIKNVFLKPSKTIVRKIEEALLVWLLETQKVVSKERMFEIYLNIIEWGPNVYGIGEATKYYFGKEPRRLKKEECIFLAMIIPQPRNFMHFFEPDGTLKKFTEGFFNFLGSRMKNDKFIDAREYDQLRANIKVVGPAQALLPKKKTTDSVDTDVQNEFFESIDDIESFTPHPATPKPEGGTKPNVPKPIAPPPGTEKPKVAPPK